MFEYDDASDAPWKVIIADDDADVHTVSRLALGRFTFLGRRLELLSAYTGDETRELIEKNPDTAVMILDVVMDERDSGLKIVEYVRNTLRNQLVRIILRTGQPGYAPQMQVVQNYDINDYREKTDLTEQKLISSMVSTLRSYRDICLVEQHRSVLEKSLQEKEVLLREVHHRVKNNLQVISSLLSMQSMSTENQESRKMCQVSRDRVRTMALIHEKLYQSDDFSQVDFADYIHTLGDELLALYVPAVPVSFAYSMEQVFLKIDHAVPCGLIVNELIINALKYAFNDLSGGNIHIGLHRGGNTWISVSGTTEAACRMVFPWTGWRPWACSLFQSSPPRLARRLQWIRRGERNSPLSSATLDRSRAFQLFSSQPFPSSLYKWLESQRG
ncbi:histidine kinase dimerization/phosphoacceptor domain -containing protein [Marispirochaeta aestuarii]|uniref:sensor histidine kinase n=1 Tax=Marispirochaeta aestuarii TaxID=1963862 RepID=UPI0029C6C00F|nr:histidine kinase dimerization/phosphoacceptor domain -containing protein [Marispirochaeta aestuarii]